MIDFNPYGFKPVDGKTALANMSSCQYTLATLDTWRRVFNMNLAHYYAFPMRYKFRMATKKRLSK